MEKFCAKRNDKHPQRATIIPILSTVLSLHQTKGSLRCVFSRYQATDSDMYKNLEDLIENLKTCVRKIQ